jgi:hypothetical protein
MFISVHNIRTNENTMNRDEFVWQYLIDYINQSPIVRLASVGHFYLSKKSRFEYD